MILLEEFVQQEEEYTGRLIWSLLKSTILPGIRSAEASRCGAESGGWVGARFPPFLPQQPKVDDADSHEFGHVIKITLHNFLPSLYLCSFSRKVLADMIRSLFPTFQNAPTKSTLPLCLTSGLAIPIIWEDFKIQIMPFH